MEFEDKQAYIKRYSERFEEFGHDPRTLGWKNDQAMLLKRFNILKSIGELNNKKILDVGCGFGDFFGFLCKQNLTVDYIGIDIVPVLIEQAQQLWPNACFYEYDILEDTHLTLEVDYVFASGVFNAKVDTLGGNTNYITAMINKMCELSRVGVYADFLSTNVDFMHPIAYHTDPCWALSIAQKQSRWVCLRHDYLPYEFCLYIYKATSSKNHDTV